MTSINEQRKKLEKTKSDLEKVLQDTGSMRKAAIKEINTNRRQNTIDDLVLAHKNSQESDRKAAVNTILRSYKNDPVMITDILALAKNNIDAKHLNNIYQIIYILEHSTTEVLNGNNNSQKVKDYMTAVKNANLVGGKTLKRMENIEAKLNIPKAVQTPDDEKLLPLTINRRRIKLLKIKPQLLIRTSRMTAGKPKKNYNLTAKINRTMAGKSKKKRNPVEETSSLF